MIDKVGAFEKLKEQGGAAVQQAIEAAEEAAAEARGEAPAKERRRNDDEGREVPTFSKTPGASGSQKPKILGRSCKNKENPRTGLDARVFFLFF